MSVRTLRRFCHTLDLSARALTLLCISLGCDRNEVPVRFGQGGHFELNQGRARDVIDIYPNGTFIHTFALPSQALQADSGVWSVLDLDGARVQFEEFRSFSSAERDGLEPGSGSPTPGVFAALVMETRGGTIKLVVDQDLGWEYVRLGPPAVASPSPPQDSTSTVGRSVP